MCVCSYSQDVVSPRSISVPLSETNPPPHHHHTTVCSAWRSDKASMSMTNIAFENHTLRPGSVSQPVCTSAPKCEKERGANYFIFKKHSIFRLRHTHTHTHTQVCCCTHRHSDLLCSGDTTMCGVTFLFHTGHSLELSFRRRLWVLETHTHNMPRYVEPWNFSLNQDEDFQAGMSNTKTHTHPQTIFST